MILGATADSRQRERNMYKIVQIHVAKRTMRETSGDVVRTPEMVLDACADMADMAQESVQVLCLNTRNRLLSREMITLGLADGSLCHPREVFRAAILASAAAIILVHNHPSGDASPSAADINQTRTLIAAGKVLGIPLLDHVIIAGEQTGPTCHSLREEGSLDFAQ